MDWQSIDNAPRDGRRILGWIAKYDYPAIVWWRGSSGWSDDTGAKLDVTFWVPISNPLNKLEN